MEGRDPDRDQGFDDWFDEPETVPEGRRRGRRGTSEPDDDPWVIPDTRERPPRRRASPQPFVVGGRQVTPTQAAIVGGSAIVVLLAILAAAGVFSSSSNTAAPPVTTVQRPPATTSSSSTFTPTTTTPTVKAPATTLKPGDSGAQVKLLQQALTALGYSPGKADGAYGPATTTAVTNFQQAQGLTADGIFGSNTLAALKSALAALPAGTQATPVQAPTSTLKPGDTGEQVKLLQQALTSLGFSPGKVDGSYGPSTKQAVMNFQKAHGLSTDGILGPNTLAALASALNTSG